MRKRKAYKPRMTDHDKMCAEIVRWAGLNLRLYPFLKHLRHWPNEGKRHPLIAMLIGIKDGPSDYFLPVPCERFHGCWLEVKKLGDKPRPAQEQWIQDMRSMGYEAAWVNTIDAGIIFLRRYCNLVNDYKRKKERDLL